MMESLETNITGIEEVSFARAIRAGLHKARTALPSHTEHAYMFLSL